MNNNLPDESINNLTNTEIPWDIINSYFKNKHLDQLVKHQIESYNHFISVQLEDTLNMFNPTIINSENDYIRDNDIYRLQIEINFNNLKIHRPQIYENNGATQVLFPSVARLRNFTYSSSILVDIHIKYTVLNGEGYTNKNVYEKQLNNIYIGKIPIMLKSNICVLQQYKYLDSDNTGECKYDPGGYFIINGSEKTVIGQERAAENQIYCFNLSKNSSKWSWSAEMKCIPDWKAISPKQINILISKKNNEFGNSLYVQIPRIKNPIPLFIIFRAFNIISDRDICKLIVLDLNNLEKDKIKKRMLYFLKASIVDANNCLTYNDAVNYIANNVIYVPLNQDREKAGTKKYNFALDVIANDIFPQCRTIKEKVYLLGHMTNVLLKTNFGIISETDRDSYVNKRIDLVGNLLNNLFRNYFNKLVKDMNKLIIKEINNGSWKSNENYENIINTTNIYKIIKSTTIENGIKRALATGDFGIKQVNSNKVGVAQVLNRLTYIASLSHLRRINTPIDKNGKLIAPRRLHNSSWGFLCPAETPEGGSIGIVKNLSFMAHITIPSNSKPLYDNVVNDIISIDDIDNNYPDLDEKVKVFINGVWVGITENPKLLYNNLKKKKAAGIINVYTSIVFDVNLLIIKICNDSGRLCRPLFKVVNNKLLYTDNIIKKIKNNELSYDDLLLSCKIDDSVIEYIDSNEQNNILIAIKPNQLKNNRDSNIVYKYTHCEIHSCLIFGILASCIPFLEHNQSPRNTYQSAMGKQAMGVYITSYRNRMDKCGYVLTYPMRPLVDTRLMNIIKLNKIPSGEQVIVAIASHTGYNQEDSILFNKGSIDRGLFASTIYSTEKDEDKKLFGNQEIRARPDPSNTKNIKFANYNKINDDGIIGENTLVEDRDIIIAKIIPIKDNKNDFTKTIKNQDESRMYRTNEETYVDKTLLSCNGDGYNFCKIKLRNFRKPLIGDKFSSRHGQKGTIGNIIPEADMPYTQQGIRPDIIINPHAIPSRMTIAQLKETLMGKILLELGLFGDGTPFQEYDINTLANQLQNCGYESHGNEVLYDGLTGEQLSMNIFIGPAFYQRLKHMVSDKQHSRSIGPMVNLTRQPAEGRSRDGGLRFGEMERDAMISHGASRFTKDRLYDSSDAYSIYVCNQCGLIAKYNDKESIHNCNVCKNKTDFKMVNIPYSCKLLFQELQTMNVVPRIMCE